jgi:hypothetical protein
MISLDNTVIINFKKTYFKLKKKSVSKPRRLACVPGFQNGRPRGAWA